MPRAAKVAKRSRRAAGTSTLLLDLEPSYHVRYCAHLDVSEMLNVAASCTAARDTWLPSTDSVWWGALLKMSGLQGDGVKETIATVDVCTAKEALHRLAPLVHFRQEGVTEGGCMDYAREAIEEVVAGFMLVKPGQTMTVLDPAFRLHNGRSPDDAGDCVRGPGGVKWSVGNAAPGFWLLTVRRQRLKFTYPKGFGGDDEPDRVSKFLLGFHENVLSAELGAWGSCKNGRAVQLEGNCNQSTATVVGGVALGMAGTVLSVPTERPEAFYLRKFHWRPTMLSTVDQSQMWFDVIHQRRSRPKKAKKAEYHKEVVGWHLQIGGCAWPLATE